MTSPDTNGVIDMAALLRAAIDQPKPTRRLRKAVNAILDAMQHDLSVNPKDDRAYTRRVRHSAQ